MWPRGFWEWVLVLFVGGTASIFLLILIVMIRLSISGYE
jgi:hypothetical protein